MANRIATAFFLINLCGRLHVSKAEESNSEKEDGAYEAETCSADEPGGCESKESPMLPLLRRIKDSSKVNEPIKVVLPGGREIHRVKLSSKPVVYEYKNFLTPEESDHLIGSAKQAGLKSGFTERIEARFQVIDVNGDKVLDVAEMRTTLENAFDIYFQADEVARMYKDLKLDQNGDGLISQAELGAVHVTTLKEYLTDVTTREPWLKGRYSDHAFLEPDKVTDPAVLRIIHRVQNITEAPWPLMEKSDIQIVRYPTRGHYNLHLDSSRRGHIPCCHRFGGPKPCRSCRWITVLFYLNDVEEGGETSFPLAGEKEFNEKEFRMSFAMNLQAKCPKEKLNVKPEKGKAVFWYSHEDPDSETEYIGPIDLFTHHGSCPVVKGVKWLANFWIKFTDDPEWDFTPLSDLARNPPQF